MNTKTTLAVAILVVVVVAAAAVLVVMSGGDDDTDSGDDGTYTATVWIVDSDGNEESAEGSGGSLSEIIESAASSIDVAVVFSNNGNVRSVGGETAADGYSWTVQRWSSPTGWAVVSSTTSDLWDGMTLAVFPAEEGTDDSGNATYTSPDIDVEYKVYFYFQMREELNSTDWLSDLPLTDEEKEEGLWIAGTGSTANEALADAVLTTFFPDAEVEITSGDTESGTRSTYIEYIVDGESGFYKYGTTSDMYGWFLTFLGWSDTEGEDGMWTYWVQYTYNPDASTLDDEDNWDYNNWSWGLYDISKYHYFGLILMTTYVEETSAAIPTPSTIPEGL